MHAPFILFTGLFDNPIEPSILCILGPWLALAPFLDAALGLRVAVHLTAIATLWPHPMAYACNLCSLLLCARRAPLAACAAVGAALLAYTECCPCGAPSETQVLAIMWAEAVEAAHFIALKLTGL
jgi:hypothetical protein